MTNLLLLAIFVVLVLIYSKLRHQSSAASVLFKEKE